MRILHICHVYPPEHAPAGVNAEELAEDLTRAGHDVTVVTGWPNHPAGVLYDGWKARFRSVQVTPAGFTVIRCGHSIHPRRSMFWRMWYYFTFAVSTFLNGLFCKAPEVILCESTPIFGPIAAMLLTKLKGARLVYRIHDVHPESALNAGLIRPGLTYRILRTLDTWVCRRSALVLTLTEGMRQCLLGRQLPPNRVLISRHWVDGAKIEPADRDNLWRQEQQIPLDQFVALHAGTIGHISGAQVIVEAANLLRDRQDILFLFVGDGPLKAPCAKLAQELGLSQVRFLPFQPAAVLNQVQAAGDLGLVTLLEKSGESSIPSKMHGYTAAGRPVVASVSHGCPTAEIIEQGDFGRVVAPQDAAALAEAIRGLADQPAEAARLGRNARRSFLANFERHTQTRKLETLLKAVVDQFAGSPRDTVQRKEAA